MVDSIKVPKRKSFSSYMRNPDLKPARIKAIDKSLSEKDIKKQHEIFFLENKILYFNMYMGAVLHSTKEKSFFKCNENAGFFDMIVLVGGKIFVGVELKSGKGGYVSPDQQRIHNLVKDAGGYVLVTNSLEITKNYFKENNFI